MKRRRHQNNNLGLTLPKKTDNIVSSIERNIGLLLAAANISEHTPLDLMRFTNSLIAEEDKKIIKIFQDNKDRLFARYSGSTYGGVTVGVVVPLSDEVQAKLLTAVRNLLDSVSLTHTGPINPRPILTIGLQNDFTHPMKSFIPSTIDVSALPENVQKWFRDRVVVETLHKFRRASVEHMLKTVARAAAGDLPTMFYIWPYLRTLISSPKSHYYATFTDKNFRQLKLRSWALSAECGAYAENQLVKLLKSKFDPEQHLVPHLRPSLLKKFDTLLSKGLLLYPALEKSESDYSVGIR